MRKTTVIGLLLIFPLLVFGQPKWDSLWLPLKQLAGSWSGKGEGQPGKGKYERTYQFVFGRTFFQVDNKATYPPSDKKPAGEVHEDKGFYSYDRSRKTFVFRQFHIEGFVIQYRLDSISPDKKTIVFISESIENIPKGFRARETYRILDENEMEEIFELAAPGKDFEVYTRVRFRRH
ncbi:MAG TPA: hypothetical protein VD993_17895 [Chitinophagaceae bacterium]|nr:hypothetical protein [Chitinophagaceae bacterium]